MTRLATILFTLVLAGCAGAVPWNAQNYAGVNHASLRWDGDGHPEITIYAGKKSDYVVVTYQKPALCAGQQPNDEPHCGTLIKYDGRGLDPVSAFKTRADVEKWVAREFAGAAKEIVPQIVDLVVRGLGLP